MNDFKRIVAVMTNHERNIWARAGYPGLKKKDAEAMGLHGYAAKKRLELAASQERHVLWY